MNNLKNIVKTYVSYRNVVENEEYWACAYKTNNTEKSMNLRQKPILGIIKKESQHYYFYPYNKKGEIIKSKRVNANSRYYTKTEEDCIFLYNHLVENQIILLEHLLNETKSDLI